MPFQFRDRKELDLSSEQICVRIIDWHFSGQCLFTHRNGYYGVTNDHFWMIKSSHPSRDPYTLGCRRPCVIKADKAVSLWGWHRAELGNCGLESINGHVYTRNLNGQRHNQTLQKRLVLLLFISWSFSKAAVAGDPESLERAEAKAMVIDVINHSTTREAKSPTLLFL